MATKGRLLPLLLKILLAISCLMCRVSESAHDFLNLLEDPDDIQTLVSAASFLANYGYISPEKGNAPPEEMDASEMSTAIRKMQKYAAVNQTGVLDQATVKMMKTDRCGLYDEPEEIKDTRIEKYTGLSRRRRYVVAGLRYKWDKTDITYKITNYPDSSTSRITAAQVRQDTARAFKVWSDVTPLSFTEVPNGEEADMEILFGAFYHTGIKGDPTFDGPGGTLAHAFFPNGGWGEADGDVHLDDSETFTHQEIADGTDYFYTVTHEIGHALGMAHAADSTSLMFPYDKGYIPNFTLPEDDMQGIQLLYGSNPDGASNDIAVTEHEVCSIGVDSLAMIKKVLYAFSGTKFWKLSANKDIIGPVEGTFSREYFQRLNKGTTAVCTRWNRRVMFFKGKNYWTYDGTKKEQSKALKIATLGVPKSPAAVMHDGTQRHTYFFKWSKVWKYDEQTQTVMEGYPVAVNKVFLGMPPRSRVRAAFIDKRGDRYLLVGRQYFRFPNGQDQLDPEYPKDFLLEYFGCQSQ